MRTYFHAGLSKIENFKINYGGLHMGGKASALECALRKLYEIDDPDAFCYPIYLHSVLVDDSELLETFDHGSAEHWDFLATEFNKQGIHGALYKNEFEPDVRKSVFLSSTDLIRGIITVETFTMDQAEELLQYLQSYYGGNAA